MPKAAKAEKTKLQARQKRTPTYVPKPVPEVEDVSEDFMDTSPTNLSAAMEVTNFQIPSLDDIFATRRFIPYASYSFAIETRMEFHPSVVCRIPEHEIEGIFPVTHDDGAKCVCFVRSNEPGTRITEGSQAKVCSMENR